jgi:hypothetical protein
MKAFLNSERERERERERESLSFLHLSKLTGEREREMNNRYIRFHCTQTKRAAIGGGEATGMYISYVAVIIKSKIILIDIFDVGPF